MHGHGQMYWFVPRFLYEVWAAVICKCKQTTVVHYGLVVIQQRRSVHLVHTTRPSITQCIVNIYYLLRIVKRVRRAKLKLHHPHGSL